MRDIIVVVITSLISATVLTGLVNLFVILRQRTAKAAIELAPALTMSLTNYDAIYNVGTQAGSLSADEMATIIAIARQDTRLAGHSLRVHSVDNPTEADTQIDQEQYAAAHN